MSGVQPHKRIIAGKVVTKSGDKSVTVLVERLSIKIHHMHSAFYIG